MKRLADAKVGQIVAQNYHTAQVLTKHGIDFCCRGGISLQEACRQHQVDLDTIATELQGATQLPDDRDYLSMSATELIREIVDIHHQYVRATIPALKTYLEKLVKVHGQRHPELHEIKSLFFEGAEALIAHLKKEELILFPYILAMEESQEKGYPLARPHFVDIEVPIQMMVADHDKEGERFRKIAQLSSNYTPPPDGCQTYRVTFTLLQEFEIDLHEHIHLENNILFPQARQLFADFPFK
jgi:regulator of cell morphogenesis and NO signaling